MKKHTITQSYELVATVEVEVPDDWTEEEIKDYFSDFPIAVTIESELESDKEVTIGGLILDSVTTQDKPFIDAFERYEGEEDDNF